MWFGFYISRWLNVSFVLRPICAKSCRKAVGLAEPL